jgi:short-subunit dehydrogenase
MHPKPMYCPSPRHCAENLAGTACGLDSAVLNIAATDVALAAYRGLMANKRVVLPGFGVKAVPLLLRLFPRSFILAAVGRLQLGRR